MVAFPKDVPMLRIRESQLAALNPTTPPATDAELAAALRDLGWFDAADDVHRRIIGAPPGAAAGVIADRLAGFVAATRRRAARAGITDQYLVLEYAGFFFRYFADWPSRDDAAPLLADSSLAEGEKITMLARVLRIAHLGSETP
jgi:hypothetical protein